MAEGTELGDFGRPRGEGVDQPEDDETLPPFPDIPASEPAEFLDTPASEAAEMHRQEDESESFTGTSLEALRREFMKTKKVDVTPPTAKS